MNDICRIIRCGVALAMLACLALPAQAGLRNRYSFNGNVNDSVGGANGVLAGASGVFAAGQVDLTANTGTSANLGTDSYVDLPNGLISSAAAAGTAGAVTMEWWATVNPSRTWARLGDFGTSAGGENVSNGSLFVGGTNLFITSRNDIGNPKGVFLYDTKDGAFNSAAGPDLATAGPGATSLIGTEIHVAAVVDMNDLSQSAAGSMYLYLNGAQVAAAGLQPGININTFVDNNNWLGRSQFNDNTFTGLFNEFRVYDMALSAAQVGASFRSGPNQLVPEPTAACLAAACGLLAVGSRRRR